MSTTDADVAELAALLRDTEAHHGPYEATAPKHHWSGWYAAYILARQDGKTEEQASEDAGAYMERELAARDAPE